MKDPAADEGEGFIDMVLECTKAEMNDSFSTVGVHSEDGKTEEKKRRKSKGSTKRKGGSVLDRHVAEEDKRQGQQYDSDKQHESGKQIACGTSNSSNERMNLKSLLSHGILRPPAELLNSEMKVQSERNLFRGNRWLESSGKCVSSRNLGYDPSDADVIKRCAERVLAHTKDAVYSPSTPLLSMEKQESFRDLSEAAEMDTPPRRPSRGRWNKGMSKSCRHLSSSKINNGIRKVKSVDSPVLKVKSKSLRQMNGVGGPPLSPLVRSKLKPVGQPRSPQERTSPTQGAYASYSRSLSCREFSDRLPAVLSVPECPSASSRWSALTTSSRRERDLILPRREASSHTERTAVAPEGKSDQSGLKRAAMTPATRLSTKYDTKKKSTNTCGSNNKKKLISSSPRPTFIKAMSVSALHANSSIRKPSSFLMKSISERDLNCSSHRYKPVKDASCQLLSPEALSIGAHADSTLQSRNCSLCSNKSLSALSPNATAMELEESLPTLVPLTPFTSSPSVLQASCKGSEQLLSDLTLPLFHEAELDEDDTIILTSADESSKRSRETVKEKPVFSTEAIMNEVASVKSLLDDLNDQVPGKGVQPSDHRGEEVAKVHHREKVGKSRPSLTSTRKAQSHRNVMSTFDKQCSQRTLKCRNGMRKEASRRRVQPSSDDYDGLKAKFHRQGSKSKLSGGKQRPSGSKQRSSRHLNAGDHKTGRTNRLRSSQQPSLKNLTHSGDDILVSKMRNGRQRSSLKKSKKECSRRKLTASPLEKHRSSSVKALKGAQSSSPIRVVDYPSSDFVKPSVNGHSSPSSSNRRRKSGTKRLSPSKKSASMRRVTSVEAAEKKLPGSSPARCMYSKS